MSLQREKIAEEEARQLLESRLPRSVIDHVADFGQRAQLAKQVKAALVSDLHDDEATLPPGVYDTSNAELDGGDGEFGDY